MTFTLQSKNDGALIRWCCDGCGEVALMWQRADAKGAAKLDASAKAHTCRVRTVAPPPVALDETDPFARCV